ncbi:MAG TPA: hypothetical protein VJN18_21350 [Polyangiaceae bacterium]|nr:hypothetical protein [Polyangiaceae bacterium]
MRSTVVWSFLGLMALAAGGLISGCDNDVTIAKSSAGESCGRTSDCSDGLKCVQGTCYQSGSIVGDGGSDGDPLPTPPASSAEGETCARTADCETGLRCFNARCVAMGAGEGGGGPGLATLGGIGETCGLSSDCGTGLACVPQINSIGVCTPVQSDLTPTGNDCHAECLEAADCCQLPVQYHIPAYDGVTNLILYGTGAKSCTELAALIASVNCNAAIGTLTIAEQARCLASQAFCNCADDTWACNELGLCDYTAACSANADVPKGCPSFSRAGRILPTTCSTDNTCSTPATAACTNDASCTNKPVSGLQAGALPDTCQAGECTCYDKQGCYRKCYTDLDCAAGTLCDLAANVCTNAPQCTTNEECALRTGDVRTVCDMETATCIRPCANDLDCNPNGLTGGVFTQLCNADKMCEAIGCTTNEECPVGASGLKMFCSPRLDAAAGAMIWSAVSDGTSE